MSVAASNDDSGPDAAAGSPPDSSLSSQRLRFRPSREAEARLLLLIDAFSHKQRGAIRHLEGRVKLAKLDFLLRYPRHLRRVLLAHGASGEEVASIDPNEAPLDTRMVRYRYGPWDPSYYAVLGSLIGRGLIDVTPLARGFGYRTSATGAELAASLRSDESFAHLADRLILLRRYLDKSGATLKKYLYELPDIADAAWHEDLT
ncbi:hypothetical protein OG589_32775 [Sphaerisporangium sp. NBC_01403]|uniref:hypothetical protein n=1 Tax=Sphaerisporangium sp. NBC_01403 TaxID=2903599 RepID=UPI00324F1546